MDSDMRAKDPMPEDFIERRKGPRRAGKGRRTHGDRRVEDVEPTADVPFDPPRHGERRLHKRRILEDRRAH
jgi:hypothetical protein